MDNGLIVEQNTTAFGGVDRDSAGLKQPTPDAQEMQKQDRDALQSYGAGGGGSYYQYARDLGEFAS